MKTGRPIKFRSGIIIGLAIFASLFLMSRLGLISQSPKKQSSIKVAIPFTSLKSAKIIDPTDTASTTEYYLLENLGIGLLRDDPADPRAYKAGLATAWSQPDSAIWEFEIGKHSKWSDGTPIILLEIADFYRFLSNQNSRHLTLFKKLVRIEIDDSTSTLRMVFDNPVDRGILHELSLADAVLTSSANRNGDWKVTSGPYSMQSVNIAQQQMTLKLNQGCILNSSSDDKLETGPTLVELFWPQDGNIESLFSSHHADLYAPSAFTFKKQFTTLDNTAPRRVVGHPTGNFLFGIDRRDASGNSPAVRKAFSALVRRYFAETQLLPSVWKFDDQVVPFGFSGRLSEISYPPVDFSALKGKHLKIVMYEALQEVRELFDGLSLEAQKVGAEIEFIYGKVPFEQTTFARTIGFKGNQRDPLGSWSFLFSGSKNPISTFREEYEADFSRISTATDTDREVALIELHRKVLLDSIVVPFVLEETPVYTSDRMDISAWNEFDMRLRFYDIRFR